MPEREAVAQAGGPGQACLAGQVATTPRFFIDPDNPMRHDARAYVSVLTPANGGPGTLRAYRLSASSRAIVDIDGRTIVDPATGYMRRNSRSYWSESPDTEIGASGAANLLPTPVDRQIYTHLSGNVDDLTAAANQVSIGNPLIDDGLLETTRPGSPSREALIEFIRGQRSGDHAARRRMGRAMPAGTALLAYGGASPGALIFQATADGFLHAIDASTGIERWAFIPREFLDDQRLIFTGEFADDAWQNGWDGGLRLQLSNDSGTVASPNDRAYLLFGLGRGTGSYYALDVSSPDRPRLLWRRDLAELGSAGLSGSPPVAAKIELRTPTQQNADKLVVVLTGDALSPDNAGGSASPTGNTIFMLDTLSGDLLWHGGTSGGDRTFADMRYPMRAAVKIVDLNGDSLADRMYAADIGGQVWRFDVYNGQTPPALVTGGVIAKLGTAAAPRVSGSAAHERNARFYSSPDVALASRNGLQFIHIGIGSGDRANRNDLATRDRFYALRDRFVFQKLVDNQYAALNPIVDSDLIDITDEPNARVPLQARGWRLDLRNGGWQGEKVLAEARTFDGRIFFASSLPQSTDTAQCSAAAGPHRLYVVDLFDGAPIRDEDGASDSRGQRNRYVEFAGIPGSEIAFVFPAADDPDNCRGEECRPKPLACIGLQCFETYFDHRPVRTFWQHDGID